MQIENPHPHRPLVLAHRGASGSAPENTLAAFTLALQQGADGVELDVQLSADGEVVVCHDSSVNRTTDGNGRVAEMPLAQLRQLDAGSWFGEVFRGERIPTLAQVFENLPRGIIDVELKPGALNSPLPDKVAALIKAAHLEQRVLVTSFQPLYLRRVRRLLPQQAIGLLILPGVPGKLVHNLSCAWLKPDYIAAHHTSVDTSFVNRETRAGRQVISWTVDDAPTLLKHRALKLAAVITNQPQAALLALEGA